MIKSGFIVKTTYVDTLWLPLKMASIIYSGDILSTTSNATLEVEELANLKI